MKAYLFDVDGVLSDPVEKQVTETQLFDQIVTRLENGSPVCLNTGRSIEWMIERFIPHFIERINDKSVLLNFIAIGEKGGTWITFDNKGNMQHQKMTDISIPGDLIEKAKDLVKQKYHDSMFFDETKETMMSIEMHDGFDIDTFHQRREEFLKDLKLLITSEGLSDKYKIDPSNISTDVENLLVGKNFGAERFLQFLKDIKCNPNEFETFGDSPSDFAMSDELDEQGKSVKMVYVGDKNKLGEINRKYQIDYIPGFSQGTLEYLQKEDVS